MKARKNRRAIARSAGRPPRVQGIRDVSVMYEGHGQNVAIRPPDVSTRGMFINTVHEFPIGAILVLKFRLALSGAQVRTRAEVRYCLRGVGVGVEFVDISTQQRRAIEKEIELDQRRKQATRTS